MLQKIRKNLGLSQKQLADKSGISVRMIQHYEQGFKNIDCAKLETLCALAAALECDLWDILNDAALKTKVKQVCSTQSGGGTP